MRIAVCDLDNCISDDGWRIQFVDPDAPTKEVMFHGYHSRMGFDRPANLHVLRHCDFALFITAAPHRYWSLRSQWIRRHIGPLHIRWELRMRMMGDYRPSAEVKIELLSEAIENHPLVWRDNIIVAIDDHAPILNAYSTLGIPCMELAIQPVSQRAFPTATGDST